MTPEEWRRRREIYGQVMDSPAAGREALLERLCAGDAELAAEMRRQISDAADSDPFIDSGALRLPMPRRLEPGAVLCSRFELLHVAGEGGMGQVWAALDRRLRETIAIKTIHVGLAAESGGMDRFQRELQLARRIGHPNVCRVFELFEDAETSPPCLFLTMELLEGETLAARLAREGRMAPAEALAFAGQIAAGLEAAHGAGVVHRDLKPANVMIAPGPGQTERAVIMDFGLARAKAIPSSMAAAVGGVGGHSVTESGPIMGTPDFMAPEQFRGEPATPATDVYALGLVLFEMLSGEAPLKGRNNLDALMRRAREGPPPLASVVPGLDPRVDRVIARCLAFEPADRYASAGAVAAALAGEDEERARRVRRRWPTWTVPAAAATAALGLIATVAVPRWIGGDTLPDDALRGYADAQRDLSEGAAARAGAELRRVIARAPRFAAAHAALAETQIELDQVFLARESIQRATDLAPDRSRLSSADALQIEAVNRLILRDCAGASASFRRRVDAVPAESKPVALASLARAFERCSQNAEARKALDEAAQLDPRNAAVRVRAAYLANRGRDFETSGRLLTEAEALYRERANFEGVGEVLLMRGTLQADRDELDPASASLGEAIALARTTGSVQQQVRALMQQAIVARKRGLLDDAEQRTNEAIDLAVKNDLETLTLQGLFTAANVHFQRNQLTEAEAGFRRALDIATRYRDEASQARALLSLASLKERLYEPDDVLALIERVGPFIASLGNARLKQQMEVIANRGRTARGDYVPVLAYYGQRLSESSGKPEVQQELRQELREVYLAMGRWPEVLEQARIVGKLSNGSKAGVDALNLLAQAEALGALGQFAAARKALQDAAAGLRPQAGVAAQRQPYSEALVEFYSGNHGAAAAKLDQFLRLPAMNPGARLFAELQICATAAFSGSLAKAERFCGEVAGIAERRGCRSLRSLARLRLAEAYLLAGRRGQAVELAKEVSQETEDWGTASEWRWRAKRLAAGGRSGGVGETGVSPSWPVSRLSWETADQESWLTRRDVRVLCQESR